MQANRTRLLLPRHQLCLDILLASEDVYRWISRRHYNVTDSE